ILCGLHSHSLNLGLDILENVLLCLLFLPCSSTNLITYLTNVEGFSIHTKGSLPPVSVGKLLSTSDIPNKNPSNQGDSYMPCEAMAHYPSYTVIGCFLNKLPQQFNFPLDSVVLSNNALECMYLVDVAGKGGVHFV